jgi:hypothetical protein
MFWRRAIRHPTTTPPPLVSLETGKISIDFAQGAITEFYDHGNTLTMGFLPPRFPHKPDN